MHCNIAPPQAANGVIPRKDLMRFPTIAIIVLSLAGCSRSTPTSAPTRVLENVDFPVGDFALSDQNGNPVSEKSLQGKVWIASFIFTHCPGPCKEVTATVTRLQKELANEPNVRFVSVTLDPRRDNEAVLRDYAKQAGADADRWAFLTGDEAAIHNLFEKHFKQSVGAKPGSGVKSGEEFTGHSTRLSAVDKKGVIRAFYDGARSTRLPPEEAEAEHQAAMKRLVEKVRELAKE